MRKYIAGETIKKGQLMYFDPKTGTVKPVEVANPKPIYGFNDAGIPTEVPCIIGDSHPLKGTQVTDTWYDEMTSMEQQDKYVADKKAHDELLKQHNFIIQEHNYGKKEFMKWVKEHENDQPVPFSKEYYGRGNGKSTKTTNEMINNLGKIPKEQYTFKRKWTPEEIQYAKNFVYEAMTGVKDNCITVCVDSWSMYSDITATMYHRTGESTWKVMGKATAKCCPTYSYSFDIGYMVAVCKLLGKELPTWIYGGKK